MGLGPPVIALYHQLKSLGIFNDVKKVIELGSQNVWCPHSTLLSKLFDSFGKPRPSQALLDSFAGWTGSARELYEGLGFDYTCVDTDGKYGALVLDINLAGVPAEHKGRYDFTTNHGTTEHLINQLNAFRMIHDFTRPGGLILHALPFIGTFDHGFFSYHPNFFDALARYNSYETLGMWLGVDWQQASFVPWHPQLLEILQLTPKTTGLLVVLHRKKYDTEFCIPFQGVYENTKVDAVSSNYCFVVDGDYYDGRREKLITREQLFAGHNGSQVQVLNESGEPKEELLAGSSEPQEGLFAGDRELQVPPVAPVEQLPISTNDPFSSSGRIDDTTTIDLAKIVAGRLGRRLAALLGQPRPASAQRAQGRENRTG